jgi:hypothetical protein
MDSCPLQHTKDRRSTCRGFSTPATFRLQGLATLLTVSSLRARVGPVSYRRRSWDSPLGVFAPRKVAARHRSAAPTCRFSRRANPMRSTGSDRRAAAPGFCPSRRSLANSVFLGRRPLVAPLGFRPSRALPQKPWPGFRPASSHALCYRSGLRPRLTCVPEYRSAFAWPPPLASPKFRRG